MILQAIGGTLLLAGVACMTTDYSEFAFMAFVGGLFLTTLGGIWGWVAKDE